ncbi:hypothetical protein VTI74DRAFT_2788 [Chaetomium olivicolor]
MTESPRAAAPPVLAPSLETELTCSICTDLLHNPLTLLDCLHTFCGACLKEWFHFQALRAESFPGPPPPPSVPVFTCPACRERVRDTKHDARVVSLVDMFLALNPGRGKSKEEKEEMDRKYKRGEKVLPRLKWEDRTEEERRLDEEERRLIEEVQRVSLREATERAAAGSSVDGGGAGRRQGRRSREGSRVRESGGEGRRRAQSAALRVEGEGSSRRRSESRQRQQQQDAEGRARQVEHQSSLRNLISTDGMDARDIEREIEEFARQIQEEGLLDGLDLDNLDLENNDELSRKITEAYRRRHRERRRDGGRRSNASAHSHRSDVSTRPRSRTDDTSRPSSRHTARSRAPSTNSNEERGRYPPSSSGLLEVQEPSRRRRTQSSGRSATLPVAPTQAEVRVGSRSQTDLTSRPGATDSHVRRPSMGVDARSSSSPTTVASPTGRGDTPANRGLPFSARAAAGLGPAQPQSDSPPNPACNRQRPERPAPLDLRQDSPTLGATPVPISPGLVSPPLGSPALPSPRRSQPPRYKEPLINCNTCSREHIEYELHFNCAICHQGDWNICLDCWRRRKGCLHWFGFGAAAWARWEKHNLTNPPTPPPHMLTANRYLPPKAIPGSTEGRRMLTTENPLDRLQSGTFCCRCSAWTNDCYWRCETCNEGEWGFCNVCVNQGLVCSHPLLALAYRAPPSSPRQPSTPTSPPLSSSTTTQTIITAAIGNFHPLIHTPPCSVCRVPIPQTEQHYHCYTCPSNLMTQHSPSATAPPPGEYNLCLGCYDALITDGSIAAENGPDGWRRCPQGGHRMVVVGFTPDERGYMRRRVVRELVGGRRLRFEECRDAAGMQVCSWWEEGTGRKKLERLFARDVSASTEGVGGVERRFTEAFPPDGGTGERAVAGWGWIPAAGVEDELMFPKGAEVVEVEDVNGEWFHGFYMGAQGLFPAPYVRLLGR